METLVELRIPDLGGAKNVPLIEWLVAVGDSIVSEQEIATLESDKATMEVPSPAAGIVRELRASIGDVVSEGDVIALLGVISEKPVQDNPPAAVQPMPKHVPESPLPMPVVSAAVTIPSNGRVPYASPHVRRMARSLGLDIHRVSGSGRGGRIRPEDLDAERGTDVAVSQMGTGSPAPAPGLLPWPQVDHARFGDTEEEAFSRIRKMSAANLARNWALIPHVTHHDEADITELERFRKLTSLGVSRAAMKPVWDGEAFRPRLVLPLSLSYDHRVIDGAAAARFVAALVRMLEDFRRALL